jgi:hypothetical protein
MTDRSIAQSTCALLHAGKLSFQFINEGFGIAGHEHEQVSHQPRQLLLKK